MTPTVIITVFALSIGYGAYATVRDYGRLAYETFVASDAALEGGAA